MNKWSSSFPSIISLCNDVQLNFDPVRMQPTTTTTLSSSLSSTSQNVVNGGGGGSTDVSILIQTHPSFVNCPSYSTDYNQSSQQSTNTYYNVPVEHETTTQTSTTTHEQFVSNEDLLQSLVAYADSFELDASIYSFANSKNQTNSLSAAAQARRRAQSTTGHLSSTIEVDPLVRHKSCDDLSATCSATGSSQPTTVVLRQEHMLKKNTPKFVPSESHPQFFFATTNKNGDEIENMQKTTQKNENVQVEECPTSTGGSNIEWGYSSDTMDELNKASAELFSNFESTTDIHEINLQYLHDLERFSSMTASMHFPQEPVTSSFPPPPPIVIRKASRDVLMKQKVDIQLLQPPTPPPPGPIIIREVRDKAPLSTQPIIIHEKLETNGQLQLSDTPSPIVFRERPPPRPAHGSSSKPTILYRHLPAPTPPPPTVVFERLRSQLPTRIQKPAPILIEKWLPYPPEQKRQVIYERASPLTATATTTTTTATSSARKRRADGTTAGKKIIVEYDQVNVIVDKDIKQREEIRRVNPNQYIKQYGNSLHSNESLSELLTNVTCSSQVKNEQHRYSHFTSVFH